MTRLAILATLAVMLATAPASAACLMSYCKGQATASTPAPGERRAITYTSRRIVGDLYNPGHNRRIQIRNNDRKILFYVERDGTVTNTHRQKVGTIELDN